jgi:hypothetical protein
MAFRAEPGKPSLQAPRLRKALLAFLAFAYLFVGLAHAHAHATELLPADIALEMIAMPVDGVDVTDSKKSSALGEHCHVCAPIMTPVLEPVAARSERPVQLVFVDPAALREDHPWLDTPPPKHLT